MRPCQHAIVCFTDFMLLSVSQTILQLKSVSSYNALETLRSDFLNSV